MSVEDPLTAFDVREMLATGITPNDVVRKLVATENWTRLGATSIVWFLTHGPSGGLHRFADRDGGSASAAADLHR